MHEAESVDTMDRYVAGSFDSRPLISEETANQLTHGLGFLASVFGAMLLVENLPEGADGAKVLGCSVYVGSLVALYAASTLSHSFTQERLRNFFRMLDQICIFALIVGTFTPFALVHLRDGLWQTFLVVLWLFAAAGSVSRIFSNNHSLSTVYFVPLAWLPVVTIGHMASVSGAGGLALIVAGGASYMAGIWFLVNDERVPYYHAVWHLFVIAGSTFHYLFVLRYVAMWQA
jgi:hemolysin III